MKIWWKNLIKRRKRIHVLWRVGDGHIYINYVYVSSSDGKLSETASCYLTVNGKREQFTVVGLRPNKKVLGLFGAKWIQSVRIEIVDNNLVEKIISGAINPNTDGWQNICY